MKKIISSFIGCLISGVLFLGVFSSEAQAKSVQSLPYSFDFQVYEGQKLSSKYSFTGDTSYYISLYTTWQNRAVAKISLHEDNIFGTKVEEKSIQYGSYNYPFMNLDRNKKYYFVIHNTYDSTSPIEGNGTVK
ncbi:hypothetical protein [Clostridium hydrogeniformans]|uniref:hypothetical protein n=1 Tax=Clostridium hydrogeniformans TaxID=349933 RepID=UPI000482603D|nr:hypothetical protein [Clostridium hydrogeniformans]